jgi:hypothetical protein
MARDVVRQVQELRKTANLNMEDRIALLLQTDTPTLLAAILAHKDYIGNETLTVEWPTSMDGDAATAEAKIDGQVLTIKLRRIIEAMPASAPGSKQSTKTVKLRKQKGGPKQTASKSAGNHRSRSKARSKSVATIKTASNRRVKAKPIPTLTAGTNSQTPRAAKKKVKANTTPKAKSKVHLTSKRGARNGTRRRK